MPELWQKCERCSVDRLRSDTRKPFGRIVEAVEFQAAPVHEVEEEAANAAVGFVEVIEHSASAKIAARTSMIICLSPSHTFIYWLFISRFTFSSSAMHSSSDVVDFNIETIFFKTISPDSLQ